MGQSRVQQGQHQRHARRRQADAAQQGGAEADQQNELEMAKAAKVLRTHSAIRSKAGPRASTLAEAA